MTGFVMEYTIVPIKVMNTILDVSVDHVLDMLQNVLMASASRNISYATKLITAVMAPMSLTVTELSHSIQASLISDVNSVHAVNCARKRARKVQFTVNVQSDTTNMVRVKMELARLFRVNI